MSPRNVSEGIFESCPFRGHLPPTPPPKKTIKIEGVKQALYADQPAAQGKHCGEILFELHVIKSQRV